MNMFKVLITSTIVLQKVKNIWSNISNSLFQESPHTIKGTVIAYLFELQKEDPMARAIQKELATFNVNVYSGQSGKPWLEVKGVLHYDGKPYIPKAL